MKGRIDLKTTTMGLAAALALCGCATKAPAPADVEVSATGAVTTPRAALAKVKELRAAGKIPAGSAAVVRFAAGVYELAEEFDVSGADAPIRFEGAPGGQTVFSGARKLGPFTAGADGVWRCAVPAGLVFEQLWVNGARAQIAKSPNTFYHYVLSSEGEGTDPVTGKAADLSRRAFRTDPKALACLAALPPDELRDVAIHVWWAWDSEWQKAAQVDEKEGVLWLQGNVGRDFFMWPKWCPRFTIENCRTALDAPGEWFLDRKKSELLYVPRAGEKPETTFAAVPALKRIAFVHDAKDVTFDGITFAHNAWTLPSPGFYPHQSAFGADAALEVSNATHVAFLNCRVEHTADYGLWFSAGSRDCCVRHTWFEDLGAGGVRLGARSWGTNDAPESLVSGVTVDDNVITSGGHVFPAGTGVFVTFAKNCRVTHNEICDLYYSGICCGWCWGWGPARSIASKGIIPGSWLWMNRFSRLTRGWRQRKGFPNTTWMY